jgi:toxin ParE1/3/4
MSFPEPRLTLSPAAQEDLIGILRYSGEKWGLEQVVVYRDRLDTALLLIGRNPRIGHSGAGLPETHRLYSVGSHVIVYRVLQNAVEVIRILHERMSILRHL